LLQAYGLGGNAFVVPAIADIPVRACDTPSNVVAVPSVAGITVTWDPVDGAYGYTIQSRIEGLSWSSFPESAPRSDTTWTVAGLTWDYMVQAQCSDMYSDWSAMVSATANPTCAPGPSNITITSTADGIDFAWEPVAGFDVSEYGLITYDNIVGHYLTDVGISGTTASVTGLVPGSDYSIAIETWATVDGELVAGIPSGAPGVIVGGNPGPPSNLQVTTYDGGASVQLNWDGADFAYGYHVYVLNLLNPSAGYQLQPTVATSTCYPVGWLYPGAWNYEFCVTSYNGNFESVCSPGVIAPETDGTVADCPAAVAVGVAVDTSPTATWSVPTITSIVVGATGTGTSTGCSGDDVCVPVTTTSALPTDWTSVTCSNPVVTNAVINPWEGTYSDEAWNAAVADWKSGDESPLNFTEGVSLTPKLRNYSLYFEYR
jgi:hypothetical protein